MHVLIIPSEHFLTSFYPLGGIFQFQQAKALHQAGQQIGILSAGVISPRFILKQYNYFEFEDNDGFPVYRKYIKQWYPQRWVRPSQYISCIRDLGLKTYFEYKQRFGKPDIIHAHNIISAGFVAQAINAIDNIPYVLTEHSSAFMINSLKSSQGHFMAPVIKDAVIMNAVSSALADIIKRGFQMESVDVFPNIVESLFLETPLSRSKNSEFVFLNIASLDANKNQAIIIEAFARHFHKKHARLRIGGKGPYEKCLKKLAIQLEVQDQIDFLGYIDRASVIQEMQNANCFVLSSYHETFGVVLIEALALGVPIVATRCGGAEDIVTERNGLLVSPGDPIAFGNAMKRMVATQMEYNPSDLRKECRRYFGSEAFIRRATQLYGRAMESV